MSWRGLAACGWPREQDRTVCPWADLWLGSFGQKHFSEGHGVSVAGGDVPGGICCGARRQPHECFDIGPLSFPNPSGVVCVLERACLALQIPSWDLD